MVQLLLLLLLPVELVRQLRDSCEAICGASGTGCGILQTPARKWKHDELRIIRSAYME